MKNCNAMLIEKQQKILAFSSVKTAKHEYLTG